MRLTRAEIGQKPIALSNNKLNILSNKKLSIQLSLSGLSFCILQEDTNTIVYLKHFAFDKKQTPFELLDSLKKAFNDEEMLRGDFSNVHVIYVNELSALVPKPLFSEDNLADYLKFNAKILKTDFIGYDEIQVNDSVNVYVPYVNINNYIYEKFGAFTYKHFSSILIDSILHFEKNAHHAKMFVHVSKFHFEIIITKLGKLQFYNTFEYSTKEDFIYYILFTAEQLKLNPETIDVILLGNLDSNDDLYKITYKYIRHVRFATKQHNFNFTTLPISNHSDFIILNSF